MVAVEGGHVRIEFLVLLPGTRQEHRGSVTDVAAAADEQLERVVEQRGVGAGFLEHSCYPGSTPRPRIARTLPSMVLISPLWQRSRKGCARSHDGLVLVEKRWWKIANGTSSDP